MKEKNPELEMGAVDFLLVQIEWSPPCGTFPAKRNKKKQVFLFLPSGVRTETVQRSRGLRALLLSCDVITFSMHLLDVLYIVQTLSDFTPFITMKTCHVMQRCTSKLQLYRKKG